MQSEAIKRIFAKDASFTEKLTAAAVSTAMSVKTKLTKVGSGVNKRKKKMIKRKNVKKSTKVKRVAKRKTSKKISRSKKMKKVKKTTKQISSFNDIVQAANIGMFKSKPKSLQCAIKAAVRATKKMKKPQYIQIPRTIKVPSFKGGMLPIIPLLAGLAKVGSITNSIASIETAIRNIRTAVSDGKTKTNRKIGKGLYLAPYGKRGKGLYLKPFINSKNY